MIRKIKTIILFLSVLLLSVEGFAQSFQSRGKEDPYALLEKAREIYSRDASSSIDIIARVIVLGLEEKDETLQAESYLLLGEVNTYLQQYDLAIVNHLKALKLFEREGDEERQSVLYRLLGKVYEANKEYRNALTYYNLFVETKTEFKKGRKKLEKSSYKNSNSTYGDGSSDKELTELQEVQLSISEIYNQLKEYELSASNLKRVQEDDAFDSASKNSSYFNNSVGDIYRDQGNDTTALEFYSSSVRIAEEKDEKDEIIQSRGRVADVYSGNNRLNDAKSYREETVEILLDDDDNVNLAKEYLEIGKLEEDLENYSAAEEYFEKTIDLSEFANISETRMEALQRLSKLAELEGRTKEALKFFKEFLDLKNNDFLQKEEVLQNRLAVNSAVNKKQQRIDLLEKNDEINSKTIEILRQNDRNQKIWIYSLLGGILLLGGTGYLTYKNMKQRRIANQLIALRSLRSQMNPHFIFNALNSVNLYISQKDERTANKYLTDFSRLMRLVLEQSQKDFITLQNEMDMISLYMRLEHDRFKDKFNYELEIDEDLDPENVFLPPMLVQPYIENAIWHGLRYKETEGKLLVKYECFEQCIKVVVEDDGIGREKSQELKTKNQLKTKSTGMYNIENRLKIINDMYKMNIQLKVADVSDSHGTRVELIIPIDLDKGRV